MRNDILRHHHLLLWLLPALLALAVLAGCTASVDAELTSADRAQAETYVRSNIARIAPEDPVLGGTFMVTSVTWIDDDTMRIGFEDGHVAFTAEAEAEVDASGEVTVGTLRIVQSDMMESSSSASGMMEDENGSAMMEGSMGASLGAGAQLGEFCGGIAGVPCAAGLTCQLDGTYPDAGGTCVES